MNNPCIKCLIYPVCLNRLINYLRGDGQMRPLTRSSIHRAYYYEIQERCNLIKDYIKELCDLAGDSSVAYYLDIETSTIDQNFKLYRRMD